MYVCDVLKLTIQTLANLRRGATKELISTTKKHQMNPVWNALGPRASRNRLIDFPTHLVSEKIIPNELSAIK